MSTINFFKCLADETRLNILLLLVAEKSLCVCELQSALKLSQPKISRHLASLRDCALLVDERQGRWISYQIHPSLSPWKRQILELTYENQQQAVEVYLKQLKSREELCN